MFTVHDGLEELGVVTSQWIETGAGPAGGIFLPRSNPIEIAFGFGGIIDNGQRIR